MREPPTSDSHLQGASQMLLSGIKGRPFLTVQTSLTFCVMEPYIRPKKGGS